MTANGSDSGSAGTLHLTDLTPQCQHQLNYEAQKTADLADPGRGQRLTLGHLQPGKSNFEDSYN